MKFEELQLRKFKRDILEKINRIVNPQAIHDREAGMNGDTGGRSRNELYIYSSVGLPELASFQNYSGTSITRNNFLSYFRFLVAATAV